MPVGDAVARDVVRRQQPVGGGTRWDIATAVVRTRWDVATTVVGGIRWGVATAVVGTWWDMATTMVRRGSRLKGATGGDIVRRQQSAGEMKTRPRAALLDEPASAGGGAKERRAAPLSLACPKTLLWRFTRASLRDRAAIIAGRESGQVGGFVDVVYHEGGREIRERNRKRRNVRRTNW